MDDNSLWKRLGAGQPAVLEKLLQVLAAETVPPVRKKVADCVQALGNQIINIDDGILGNRSWTPFLCIEFVFFMKKH